MDLIAISGFAIFSSTINRFIHKANNPNFSRRSAFLKREAAVFSSLALTTSRPQLSIAFFEKVASAPNAIKRSAVALLSGTRGLTGTTGTTGMACSGGFGKIWLNFKVAFSSFLLNSGSFSSLTRFFSFSKRSFARISLMPNNLRVQANRLKIKFQKKAPTFPTGERLARIGREGSALAIPSNILASCLVGQLSIFIH